MMEFNEFTNSVIEELEKSLDNVTVHLQIVDKNNGIKLHGLTFRNEYNIAPTIYIDEHYNKFLQGKSLQSIVEEIKEMYLANRLKRDFDLSVFTDFEKVKSRIVFSLINFERNKELLNKIPFIQFHDVAIIFRYSLCMEENEIGTILIHNNHLEMWNASKEDLLELAHENTPKIYGCEFKNLARVLFDKLDLEEIYDAECKLPMYVLTNCYQVHGASCILYKGLLKEIAEQLKSNLYILPSSIHEVIIIPTNNKSELKYFAKMVRSVNETEVTECEMLSDSCYYYSRKKDEITM